MGLRHFHFKSAGPTGGDVRIAGAGGKMAGYMIPSHLNGSDPQPEPGPAGTRTRQPRAWHGCLLLCLALLGGAAVEADVPPPQVAEVEHLLDYLAGSDCQMIRNGKSHSGGEGANHVRRKYDHFRDEIDSTEAFIDMAATKSLRTGQPYQVDCPGQPPVPSAEWLLTELQNYRASQ